MAKKSTKPAPRRRKGSEPRGGKESFENLPDPSATNAERRTRGGTRSSVPGAGITRRGADAGPARARAGEPEQSSYPGKKVASAIPRAPGARRESTTHSGVSAIPSSGGGITGRPSGKATEAITGSDAGAALSLPGTMGPERSPGLREIADPNFPISQRAEAKREKRERAKTSPRPRK